MASERKTHHAKRKTISDGNDFQSDSNINGDTFGNRR